jgi:hypothetical protein
MVNGVWCSFCGRDTDHASGAHFPGDERLPYYADSIRTDGGFDSVDWLVSADADGVIVHTMKGQLLRVVMDDAQQRIWKPM